MEQRHRKLTIAGVDRTLNLLGKTLTISDKIPGKSTCSFEMFDTKGDIELQEGLEVILTTPDYAEEFGPNLLSLNQADVETDTAGFISYWADIYRVTTEAWHGSACLKVVTETADGYEGFLTTYTKADPLQTYTASAYVKGSGKVYIRLLEFTGTKTYIGGTQSADLALTGEWQRIEVAKTFGSEGAYARLEIFSNPGQASPITFYADGMKIENNHEATPFTFLALRDNPGMRIFAGEIIKFQDYVKAGVTYFYVSCADYNAILDRVLVATAFDAMLAGEMVKKIHGMKLVSEGITLGKVEEGPATSRSVFDWVPVSSALDDIEKLTGITWNVDYYKVLDYFPPGAKKAPFSLTETSNNYSDLVLERNTDKYRNVQVFRPGWLETTAQTETPTPPPDGSSRTFTTRFPLARRPQIFIDGVEVPPNDIGVNGLDGPGTKKWYFSRQSPQVSQDTYETVLPAGATLEIIYTGLYNRIFVKEKEDEIAARKRIEGGSGRWESYEDKATIDDFSAADQYLSGLLRKYGSISNKITFRTQEHGLRAGMVIPVDIPSRGIKGDFLIESVTGRADGPGLMIYNVKAIDGEVVGGWVDFFRSLVIKSRDFAIRDNEYVSMVQDLAEPDMESIGDAVSTYNANPPFQYITSSGNIIYGRWQWLA